MKRSEIEAILNNVELDAAARIDQIMAVHGRDTTAWQQERATLTQERDDARASGTAHADYDAVAAERDELRAYKADREFGDRFAAVVGGAKFANEYTEKGVRRDFAAALSDAGNKDKTDADIYAGIVHGHESEYFVAKPRIIMPAPQGGKLPKDEFQAYTDQKYKDDPYYKPKG